VLPVRVVSHTARIQPDHDSRVRPAAIVVYERVNWAVVGQEPLAAGRMLQCREHRAAWRDAARQDQPSRFTLQPRVRRRTFAAGMVDLYNRLNSSSVQAVNTSYGTNGATWLQRTQILQARMIGSALRNF
jgi:hypothetical protein